MCQVTVGNSHPPPPKNKGLEKVQTTFFPPHPRARPDLGQLPQMEDDLSRIVVFLLAFSRRFTVRVWRFFAPTVGGRLFFVVVQIFCVFFFWRRTKNMWMILENMAKQNWILSPGKGEINQKKGETHLGGSIRAWMCSDVKTFGGGNTPM